MRRGQRAAWAVVAAGAVLGGAGPARGQGPAYPPDTAVNWAAPTPFGVAAPEVVAPPPVIAQTPAAPPALYAPAVVPAPPVVPTPAAVPASPVPAFTAPVAAVPQPGASPLAGGPPAAPASADPALTPHWRHQLFFETADKTFSLFLGGRVQFDTANYAATSQMRANVPGTFPLEDGVTFRRMRLQTGGTIHQDYEFLLEVDFFNEFVTNPGPAGAGNTARPVSIAVPTDAWFAFRRLPVVGNLKVGNQKPPISFEHITSSRFLNFMERSLGFDAFVENGNNGFLPGVTAYDTFADRRGTWAVGAFKNTRSVFAYNVGRNEAELTGRVTYLPVFACEGKRLVHVGVGASHRDTDDGEARYRSRLDVRNSPGAVTSLVADTGVFDAGRQQTLVPEFVAVYGPLSVQSEYYAGWAQGTVGRPGTAFFQSAYVEAHYFLTGEHRAYDREKAAFGRVIPKNRMAWRKDEGFSGWGAWQVAARFTYLDLNSGAIEGGVVHDLTLGLNWFFNPNAKLQANYSLADRDVAGTAGDGIIHGFGTRLAFDF